jgi:hypothetical protein
MIFATFEFFEIRRGILDVLCLHRIPACRIPQPLRHAPDLASESRSTPDFFACFALPSGTSCLSFDSPSEEVSSLELQVCLNP